MEKEELDKEKILMREEFAKNVKIIKDRINKNSPVLKIADDNELVKSARTLSLTPNWYINFKFKIKKLLNIQYDSARQRKQDYEDLLIDIHKSLNISKWWFETKFFIRQNFITCKNYINILIYKSDFIHLEILSWLYRRFNLGIKRASIINKISNFDNLTSWQIKALGDYYYRLKDLREMYK